MFAHVAARWPPSEGRICEANVLDGVKGNFPLQAVTGISKISSYIACVYSVFPLENGLYTAFGYKGGYGFAFKIERRLNLYCHPK